MAKEIRGIMAAGIDHAFWYERIEMSNAKFAVKVPQIEAVVFFCFVANFEG